MFNINNNLKHNLIFLAIFILLLHILATDIAIFRTYWEERLFFSDGHWTNQRYFNFEDYDKYMTIDTYDIFLLCYESWDGLLLFGLYIVLFIFYGITPIIQLLINRRISFTFLLVIDILVLFLYGYILMELLLNSFSDNPMIGIIPISIFIPIVFFILLLFRIYQYKKRLIF